MDKKQKLNDSKTEYIIIGRPCTVKKATIHSVRVGAANVPSNQVVKNLGVTFDRYMNMEMHVSNVCKSCFYHLRNIKCIRKYLSKPAAESVIHALISSRLDYCNGLL